MDEKKPPEQEIEFVIPWEDIKAGKLSPEEIENIRCETLKEIQARRRFKSLVIERINIFAKAITNLEQKRRDLITSRQKCQVVIDNLMADAEIYYAKFPRSKFWENKNT